MGGGISGRFQGTKGGCFVAGTLVLTEEGLKPIESIKAGELVFSKNIETGETGFKKVIETFVHTASELVIIYCGNTIIESTDEHPFWVWEEGWRNAEELEKGMLLTDAEGQAVAVEKTEKSVVSKEVLVYNFHVEEFYIYFISELNILVHNSSKRKNIESKSMGDADIKDLDKLPKKRIKELGGEDYTQNAKKNSGRSKADLYWDKDGNVYSITKKGDSPQWIDWIPRK